MFEQSELAKGVIEKYTAVEGGFVDHPSDLGKATNHGITRATADEHSDLWEQHGWDGEDMRDLPQSLAYHIYQVGWWDRMMLDEVAQRSEMLAERMFDFGINAGRLNCVKSLQKILRTHNKQGKLYDDIEADGFMGSNTLKAMDAFLEQPYEDQLPKLDWLMLCSQQYHYIDISDKRERNEDFTNGWTARAFDGLKDFIAEYF